MSSLDDLRMYARFARDLPGFLGQRLTLAQAESIVRRRLERREESFLQVVERGVFGYPRSPYLPLLRQAGCELGDLRNLVHDRGLDGALESLRAAGVYVTFEEFKGRAPIVRGGLHLQPKARDFDNPYLSHAYSTRSGGSTGAGTRVDLDLDYLVDRAAVMMLLHHAHGVLHTPLVIWRGILPDNTAVSQLLRGSLIGHLPRRWFAPPQGRALRPPLKESLATHAIVATARACGVPFPWPETTRLDQAERVAEAIVGLLRRHGSCVISTIVSLSLRIALEARARDWDLTGLTFLGGSEPPTPAKVREITRGGARFVPMYVSAETGYIGLGCVNRIDANDTHFAADGLGLIQHSRTVPGTAIEVPAFLFTTLLRTAPKLMLNVESDDYGVLEDRRCGCPLEAYGYTRHIREVRSYRKLTGEGVTLIGSEMERILEEVLPARFGGGPLDYQLGEEEDEQGFTRLILRVSPRVGAVDDTEMVACVLQALHGKDGAATIAGAFWSQAGSLRVRREEPIATHIGKLLPLHLTRRAQPEPTAVGPGRAPGR